MKKEALTGFCQGRIVESESAEAPDLFRLVEKDSGGISNEAHGEMGDGHLVTDGAHFVMGGLLDFAIAEASEVAFDFGAETEGLFEGSAIAGNLSVRIIGNVEILGTAIGFVLSEAGMMNRATVWKFKSGFGKCLNRASELGPFSQAFGPNAGRRHFETGIAERATVRAESFRCLLVAGIDGDESLAVKLVDDEVIEIAFIVGGIGNKEGALSEAIKPLEIFNT